MLRWLSRSSRRLDWMREIAVEIDLQQRRGMISRPTCRFRNDALKSQRQQIQFGYEGVDHSHWIVFRHVIVEELGEQNALRSVFAIDKALHPEPRLNPSGFYPNQRFHTALYGDIRVKLYCI